IRNCAAFRRCTPKRPVLRERCRCCSARNGSWADFTMWSSWLGPNSKRRCRRSTARMFSGRRPIITTKNRNTAISCSRNFSGASRKFSIAGNASEKAFGVANLKPRDLHGADVHDCCSITEIVVYEILGLAEPGKGAELAKSGVTALPQVRNEKMKGKFAFELPVNAGGGLIADGHPVGATGVRQVVEAYQHLTGQAGARQIRNAKRFLTFNMGGSLTTSVAMLWGRD